VRKRGTGGTKRKDGWGRASVSDRGGGGSRKKGWDWKVGWVIWEKSEGDRESQGVQECGASGRARTPVKEARGKIAWLWVAREWGGEGGTG